MTGPELQHAVEHLLNEYGLWIVVLVVLHGILSG